MSSGIGLATSHGPQAISTHLDYYKGIARVVIPRVSIVPATKIDTTSPPRVSIVPASKIDTTSPLRVSIAPATKIDTTSSSQRVSIVPASTKIDTTHPAQVSIVLACSAKTIHARHSFTNYLHSLTYGR
ncbi:hypothetical protein I350_00070 [Cryptococcus amylolentus CBS 6273]|uniref:Uncharacterized protein n=1 Tax=Cryptococcus amylolentus CBS 6273 TaxID=1296118 RepID=A0A1E3KDW4_9TREE|nr:hypothetical protein I350_00070 [Cryptococcus amylolentus CBS 6273]